LSLDADLYHLHDPELLLAGVALSRVGKCVVFDSHEDVSKQLMAKHYIPKPLRHIVATAYSFIERQACNRLAGVVTATPSIRAKFARFAARTEVIHTYPPANVFECCTPLSRSAPIICYIGSIASSRGIEELVRSLELCSPSVQLLLAGSFNERGLLDRVSALPGWSRVSHRGFCDLDGIRGIVRRASVGMVTLLPTPNHLESLPLKLFEYMAAGIPVIASDFPLWRSIVDGFRCGLVVNPLDPQAIANAIDYLITHPTEAQEMGARGRNAVIHQFNWESEFRKVLGFYRQILTS